MKNKRNKLLIIPLIVCMLLQVTYIPVSAYSPVHQRRTAETVIFIQIATPFTLAVIQDSAHGMHSVAHMRYWVQGQSFLQEMQINGIRIISRMGTTIMEQNRESAL